MGVLAFWYTAEGTVPSLLATLIQLALLVYLSAFINFMDIGQMQTEVLESCPFHFGKQLAILKCTISYKMSRN